MHPPGLAHRRPPATTNVEVSSAYVTLPLPTTQFTSGQPPTTALRAPKPKQPPTHPGARPHRAHAAPFPSTAAPLPLATSPCLCRPHHPCACAAIPTSHCPAWRERLHSPVPPPLLLPTRCAAAPTARRGPASPRCRCSSAPGLTRGSSSGRPPQRQPRQCRPRPGLSRRPTRMSPT